MIQPRSPAAGGRSTMVAPRGRGRAPGAAGGGPGEHPAQVAGVAPEGPPQRGDLGDLSLRQLVEHPRLGERPGRAHEALVQDADDARVEAVEGPDLVHHRHAPTPAQIVASGNGIPAPDPATMRSWPPTRCTRPAGPRPAG